MQQNPRRAGAKFYDRQRYLLPSLQQIDGGSAQLEFLYFKPLERLLRQMAAGPKRIRGWQGERACGVCRKASQRGANLRIPSTAGTGKDTPATRHHWRNLRRPRQAPQKGIPFRIWVIPVSNA